MRCTPNERTVGQRRSCVQFIGGREAKWAVLGAADTFACFCCGDLTWSAPWRKCLRSQGDIKFTLAPRNIRRLVYRVTSTGVPKVLLVVYSAH